MADMSNSIEGGNEIDFFGGIDIELTIIESLTLRLVNTKLLKLTMRSYTLTPLQKVNNGGIRAIGS